MKPSLSAKYFVAHEVIGGKEKRLDLLATLKSTKEIPDTLEITGVLMDDSKNMNNWQVPLSEFDILIDSLKGAPYLKDHEETVDSIAGQVTDVSVDGNIIHYKAEIDDPDLIKKILRGRVKYSSVQIDTEELLCSKCYDDVNNKVLSMDESVAAGEYYSRRDGDFTHLHDGAHEVVLHPEGKEISAVVFPAYKIAEMGPVGFKAALDRALSQRAGLELRSKNYILGKDGDVTERDASDQKQNPKPKVRVLTDENKVNTLTAQDIAEVVATAMREESKRIKAQEEQTKMQDAYKNFMSTWEGAVGKISELEKNYNAGVTKLEDILTKYEDMVKQQEEFTKAGKTLREARKHQTPPDEKYQDGEEVEAQEEDEEEPVEAKKRQNGESDEKMQDEEVTAQDEEVKEQDEEYKEQDEAEAPKASKRRGKAAVGKADDKSGMLRTGLDSKHFPPWYREIVAQVRKHPRREA